jgi:hypothetical protein
MSCGAFRPHPVTLVDIVIGVTRAPRGMGSAFAFRNISALLVKFA